MTWLTWPGIWEAGARKERGKSDGRRRSQPAGLSLGPPPRAAEAQAPWDSHSYLPRGRNQSSPPVRAQPWVKELPALSWPVPGLRRPRAPTQNPGPRGNRLMAGAWRGPRLWEGVRSHTDDFRCFEAEIKPG